MIRMIMALIFCTSFAALPPQSQWCCRIVGLNSREGIALARNDANGKTFLFKAKNAGTFQRLTFGARVNFNRKGGVAVQGLNEGSFPPVKPGHGGSGGGTTVEIDCSVAPIMCRGAKPGTSKIIARGATTWADVVNFCYDPENIDACSAGPN